MPELVRMTQSEFVTFLGESIAAFAADKVASGDWAQDDALKLSQKSFDELLPQGLATPDHYLFTIHDAQRGAVGDLWIAVQQRAGKCIAYVYDVKIKPEYRRKGLAYGAFEALEAKAAELGFSGIALHVFGHNMAAQALYSKLGFRMTDVNMYKSVAIKDT